MSTRASKLRIFFIAIVAIALTGCGRSELLLSGGSGGNGNGGNGGHGGHGGNGGNGGNAGSPPTGCTSDAQCNDPTPHCRLDDGVCVECTSTPQCPNNEVCDNFKCVGFCGPGGACDGNLTCCSPLCVDVTTDPKNCGSCGKDCGPFNFATATCAKSECGLDCNKGHADCNKIVDDGCEINTDNDAANCGSCGHRCATDERCSGGKCLGACGAGGTCPNGQTCCSGQCEDTKDDPTHCGSCTNDCTAPAHATVTCEASKCAIDTCADGFGDCNGVESDGCEVKFSNDPKHCGSCTNACKANETCSGGVCVGGCGMGQTCQMGFTCCDDTSCADTTNDPLNCGMCDNVCNTIPHGTSDCAASQCRIGSCDAGFADCDMKFDDGCEVDTKSDANNCGSCGHSCGAGGVCQNGTCIPGCNGQPPCDADEVCCASGCSNTQTDPNNCGMCTHACGGGGICDMGTCETPCNGGPACTGAQTCCTTGCADTTSDSNNCGMCGHACPPTQGCINSACSDVNAFNPTVNPTFLAPGIHNFSTINIPAGVTVFVAGPGPDSGTLDLRATGAIVINGTIDLSGGPGVEALITSESTQKGKAGPGGYTGEPYQSAAYSAACAFIGGNSGQLGFQAQGTTGNCNVASTTTCIDMNDPTALIFASPLAQFGGGGGTFSGFRSYGAAGGGPAGGAAGALGALFPGEQDCSGVAGADGATAGAGGFASGGTYRGRNGTLGVTQCAGIQSGAKQAWVGGGGGGSIGAAAAADLGVFMTFQTGSGGGGGSSDYLDRPAFGGTSGGGGGGGALKLSSPVSITMNGSLLANGGDGGDANIGTGMNAGCDPQPGAAGGGGSGGVIYLSSPTVKTSGTISAVGGGGGAVSEFATGGGGGRGGLGRIRVSATQASCTLGGSFNPPLASGCAVTPGAGTAGSTYVGTFPN